MAQNAHKRRDYIEWEERDAARKQADDRARVEAIFDTEVRRRVGELIARASEDAEKSTK